MCHLIIDSVYYNKKVAKKQILITFILRPDKNATVKKNSKPKKWPVKKSSIKK